MTEIEITFPLLFIISILFIIIICFIAGYNSLVSSYKNVEKSKSLVEVYLKNI